MRWQAWLLAIAIILISTVFYYRTSRPLEITTVSGPIGQKATLKQRMIFLVSIEKAFHQKGWLASFDLEGEDGKYLKVYWEQLSQPFATQLIRNQVMINDIREMGFKRLILNNGKRTWNIDLKN